MSKSATVGEAEYVTAHEVINNNSIRQRLAAAKAQEPIMQGHDLSGKERFRFFFSDEGYRNAKCSEQEGKSR